MPVKTHDVEQPDELLETDNGICVRAIKLSKAGNFVGQHSHDYGHTTFVAHGSVAMWLNGEYKGDFDSPVLIPVAAHADHTYQAVTDDVVLACISRQEK
jgi:quercetin dioxygenase-like cupin family protein